MVISHLTGLCVPPLCAIFNGQFAPGLGSNTRCALFADLKVLCCCPVTAIAGFVNDIRRCESIGALALEFCILAAARSSEVVGTYRHDPVRQVVHMHCRANLAGNCAKMTVMTQIDDLSCLGHLRKYSEGPTSAVGPVLRLGRPRSGRAS
jgi:hypothetical protein